MGYILVDGGLWHNHTKGGTSSYMKQSMEVGKGKGKVWHDHLPVYLDTRVERIAKLHMNVDKLKSWVVAAHFRRGTTQVEEMQQAMDEWTSNFLWDEEDWRHLHQGGLILRWTAPFLPPFSDHVHEAPQGKTDRPNKCCCV